MKSDKKLIGTGIVTAIAASLCCITPILALVAGTSGIASSFSWLEPFRPYLIGITFLVLGFAWYQKLKPQKTIDCNCETEEKTTFMQSKLFLGITTVFALIMLAFPYYSAVFYPTTKKENFVVEQEHIQTIEYSINGMTCTGCEEHVNSEVNQLPGIINSVTSYKDKNAIVTFDKSKTNPTEIEKAILKTGYTITDQKEN